MVAAGCVGMREMFVDFLANWTPLTATDLTWLDSDFMQNLTWFLSGGGFARISTFISQAAL